MKLKFLAALLAAAQAPAFALEIPKAVGHSDCLACHAPDRKVVGPSFLEIADRYRGKGMAQTLVRRVKEGSVGVWGKVPATAHQYESDAQLRDAVDWILGLNAAMLAQPKEGEGGASLADQAAKIMKGSDCLACHKPDGKLIGPAFNEIKTKYKGDAQALPVLVKKVKEGGSGNWGAVPMTGHPGMKDKDIETLVRWILGEAGGAKAPTASKAEKPKSGASTPPAAPSKEAAMKIMKASDCFACHQEQMKVVGPSFKEIAAKYKGDAGASKLLVRKVKEGGQGVWGALPMTPHPGLKDEDIQTAVDWILTVK